jgi:predicted RNA binding protein YcfA (HicA-like mRNA interferase family)
MEGRRLPILKPKELIAVLLRLGFVEKPLKATSHRRYSHPDGRKTTVPVHPGTDISRGLLRKIIRDLEMTPEDFLELLK